MEKNMFKGLLSLIKPYKWLFLFAIICTSMDAVLELLFPLLLKYGMDNYQKDGIIIRLCLMCLIVGILNIIARYGNELTGFLVSEKIQLGLINRIFNHMHTLGFDYFDNSQTGKMILYVDDYTDKIRHLLYTLRDPVINTIIGFTMIFIVYTKINPILIVFSIIPITGCIMTQVIFYKIINKRFKAIFEIGRKLNNFIEDHIAGIRTTIGFSMQDNIKEKLDDICKSKAAAKKVKAKTLVSRDIFMLSFENLYYVVIVICGIYLVKKNVITMSELVLYYGYAYRLINPLNTIGRMIDSYQEGKQAYNYISELLNTQSSIKISEKEIKPEIKGDIKFNNVSFGYDRDNIILKDINLHIKSGEFLAICGESGIGKSTIAGLIPRYYDVLEGSIQVDGYNIKDIDLQYLRKNIGVVSQSIYLYQGTVYDNIAFAVPGASMEEVIKAAKLANAHEFISKLPNGYNSDIGEKGIKLSGGQKQRIALARLFLLNPSILIFDEATSALDNESERLVQDSLEKLAKGKTCIVIAHRLSTIQNADRIILLAENGIEEEGTHKQLIKFGGKYAKLAR